MTRAKPTSDRSWAFRLTQCYPLDRIGSALTRTSAAAYTSPPTHFPGVGPMPARKTWRLGTTFVAGLLLFTVASEGGYPQVPPPAPPTMEPVAPPLPANHVVRAPVPHQQAPTVEQLLDQITAIRSQKAELEKREQAMVAALRAKLAAQKERLTKLGIAEKAPAPRAQADELPPPIVPSN